MSATVQVASAMDKDDSGGALDVYKFMQGVNKNHNSSTLTGWKQEARDKITNLIKHSALEHMIGGRRLRWPQSFKN